MGRLRPREGMDPARAHRVTWAELGLEFGSLGSLPRVPILKEDFFLASPHSMRDLSSPARDRTHAPCNGSVES